MEKRWYTISFQAKLDDSDIKAMNNHFFDAMEVEMCVSECRALDIDPHCDQSEDE